MTPEFIIEQLTAEGVQLSVAESGSLKAAGQAEVVSRWLPILKEHKPGIVEALRSIETVTIEPAAANSRPIYWEAVDGQILGPAVPEFLAQVGKTFWIVTTFEGQIRWIRSDRLRSRKAFQGQPTLRVVEPIRSI